jgi:hypothetical protein
LTRHCKQYSQTYKLEVVHQSTTTAALPKSDQLPKKDQMPEERQERKGLQAHRESVDILYEISTLLARILDL